MIAGTGIGLAMGLNRLCERSLLALIPLMLTTPTILMVFVAIMWFGYSEAGGLVAVMAVVTPFVAVNMYEGTKAMDKSLIDMAVTFKAPRSLLLRKVYLPQLMPYIFSAFRYAFGQTWKIVALAETFGLKFGIGYMFFFWFQQFDIDPDPGLDHDVRHFDACPRTRRLRPARKPGICVAKLLARPGARISLCKARQRRIV